MGIVINLISVLMRPTLAHHYSNYGANGNAFYFGGYRLLELPFAGGTRGLFLQHISTELHGGKKGRKERLALREGAELKRRQAVKT